MILSLEKLSMMKGFDNKQQASTAMNLAIGRIFLLGSRPYQEGDIQKYEAAKDLIYDAADYLGINQPEDDRPSYARDYYKIHHD